MNHRLSLLKGARRRRIRNDERGSIFPYLCIACGALAMVALLLMLSLGDTTLHRRDASNAADAAALAAAGAWADSIESMYDDAVDSDNADGLWGGIGKGLGSYAGRHIRLPQWRHGHSILRRRHPEDRDRQRGDQFHR